MKKLQIQKFKKDFHLALFFFLLFLSTLVLLSRLTLGNFTINLTSTLDFSNSTFLNTSEENSSTVIQPSLSSRKEIIMSLSSPEVLTRGQKFELLINLTNKGDIPVKNFEVELQLPQGFEELQRESSCTSLKAEESCLIKIELKTTLDTFLGKNEIGVRVFYE